MHCTANATPYHTILHTTYTIEHDTYYVVAQMGRIGGDSFIVIDYMLGTIFLIGYLLFNLFNYLNVWKKPIDISRSLNLLLNNQNNNQIIQSAGNCKGSSETIRQFSNVPFEKSFEKNFQKKESFLKWFAGIVDGDGYFDIRKCIQTTVFSFSTTPTTTAQWN